MTETVAVTAPQLALLDLTTTLAAALTSDEVSQAALAPALQRLADARGSNVLDEQSRNHLRNTEIYLSRLLEEVAHGRAQSTAEIRNEIKVLARTIAAIAEEAPR